MRFLIAFVALFISLQAFSCERSAAEGIVTNFISQEFSRSETVRTLKLGTIQLEKTTDTSEVTVVHAIVETERFGRKVSEQVLIFKLNEFCRVTSSHGATVQKVRFNNL